MLASLRVIWPGYFADPATAPRWPGTSLIVGRMTLPVDCYTCAGDAVADQAPPWERIASDSLWRVAHAFNSALPGWLVLMPRRHVTAIADLTDSEASLLGTWQVRLSRALQQVLGCQKTYVAQFAEAEGFSHVHFHIVPRPPDLPRELRGPRIFQRLGATDRPHIGEDQMTRIAAALAVQLS
jgi:diadenosine tetraphosphate (Ap4A) HIT family hydrolase